MTLGIDCPHCHTAPVSVAKRAWFMRGFLLAARYGSRLHVGCRRCVNRQVAFEMLASLVLGWWCFPWGLGTPIVVLQNLVLLLLPSSMFTATLDGALRSVGIRWSDVEVDESGRTAEERRLLGVATAVLAEAMWADGAATPAEYETAVNILTSLSDGRITSAEAAHDLEAARGSGPDLTGLPWDFQVLLLHMAVDTVASDGQVAGSEAAFLHDLGARLDLERDVVETILNRLRAVDGARSLKEHDPDFARACSILGVHPDDQITDVRKRYRSVMMAVHPDVAGSDPEAQAEAHRRSQEVNWAYDYVLGTAA